MNSFSISRRGMSLLEMLLVVFLVTLAMTLTLSGMSYWNKQRQVDELRQGIVLLKRNIQGYYQGIDGYEGLTTANVKRLKLNHGTPFLFDGNTLETATGEQVSVSTATVSGNPVFVIGLSNLPASGCSALVSSFYRDPALVEVVVGNTTYTAANSVNAATACVGLKNVSLKFQ